MDKLKVLEGKDGWLFLDNDTNKVIDQITDNIKFDKYHEARFRLNQQIRHGYLKSQGIKYFSAIVPNKEAVYSMFLPEYIKLSENRIIRRCEKELLNHNINYFIYPIEELDRSKHTMETYRKANTHWNQYGAFIFYQELMKMIMKEIKIPILFQADISFTKTYGPCDLSSKLGYELPDDEIIGKINNKSSELIFNNKIQNTGNLKIYENKSNSNLLTAVIFRDSFTDWMEHFIAESFSKVIFVHQRNLDYLLIEKYKPDIVCSIHVERFASGVPEDILGRLQSQNESRKKQSIEKK